MTPADSPMSMRSGFRALCLATSLTLSGTAFAASPSEPPGTHIQLDPSTLPAPDTTEAVGNFSELVTASDQPSFQLPPGFAVNLFAKGFDRARWMAIAPDGAVLLSQGRNEEILRIVDSDGDGVADSRRVLADGFHAPHGMAFHDGMLYVADTEGIWRLPYRPDGTLPKQSFSKMDMADFKLVMDVHLMGAAYCSKAVWEIMKEQTYGRIVMTSSSSGLYGNFGQSNYSAAKLAVVGLMNSLAQEGEKYNVRVNSLAPAALTRMTEDIIPDPARGGRDEARAGQRRGAGAVFRGRAQQVHSLRRRRRLCQRPSV